jgi:iron complex outermembrane receptor protein
MKNNTIVSLIGLTLALPAVGAEPLALDEITVKVNRFERKDTDTTYASEIHTSTQIETSGAATLYDYLAQQTSLNLLSNFGSKATPSINLRGFGGENGYQNTVVTLDGQRLNNIDSVPQLLGAIPLGNIDRIEISKGSGSVVYGDGATAGVVNIYTKNKTGVTINSSLGNFGQKNHSVNAGISEKYIDLSATLSHDSHDGFSKKDITGHKDKFDSESQNIKLRIKPNDNFRLIAEGTSSRNNIGYVNYLDKNMFNANPRQAGTRAYLQQSFDTDQWRAGFEYDFTNELRLTATHYQEDKKSEFPAFIAKYDYHSNDVALSFKNEIVSAIIGYQSFNGDRIGGFDITSKDNSATFIQTEYRPIWLTEQLTISAGARRERVEYQYAPSSGTKLNDNDYLNAWDIGANYRFTPELSVFTNYNKSFQTPDIDRFFRFDSSIFETVFDGFIKPTEVKTLNLGLNHVTNSNRLKVNVFYSKLNNEIYLDPTFIDPVFLFSGRNANADKTHKYGFEVQDFYKFTDKLSASMIYNFTRAIIDKETGFDGTTIRNKNLPGVPKHTIIANVNYRFWEHASLNLNHTWRSTAYIYDDFLNNVADKQDSYQSTNVALNYQFRNLNFYTSINNIFERENNIQTTINAIYPVDFVRTWRVGMKADF